MNGLNFGLKGIVHVQQFRAGKLVIELAVENSITKFGVIQFLTTGLGVTSASVNSSWSHGLMAAGAVLSRDDTQSSHGGWTELNSVAYLPNWTTVSLPTTVTTLTSPPVPTEDVACRRASITHAYSTFGSTIGTVAVGGGYITSTTSNLTSNPGRIVSQVTFPASIFMQPEDTLIVTTFLQIFDEVSHTSPNTVQPLDHSLAIAL